jgi:hypothetical protein
MDKLSDAILLQKNFFEKFLIRGTNRIDARQKMLKTS